LPYDPLQPSIRAPDERSIDENSSNENNTNKEYVPSRQHQVSGTSFRHDPSAQSSTIENLDDDDDDEDVYDPNKPTLFQKIQTQTNNQAQQPPTNAPLTSTESNGKQRDEGRRSLKSKSEIFKFVFLEPTDASEDDLNQVNKIH
jgi:hypothetical protein